MKRFALVVFDMDGVLTDSSGCHAKAYEELWARIGVPGPPYPRIAGQRTESVVAEVTAPLTPPREQLDAWVRFKQERARAYLASARAAFPDVAPALQRLRLVPVRLALGTGASARTTRQLLAQLGLDEAFPVVVTAEDVTAGKPAPDTFRLAIERSGSTADETLVVEDSASGLEAAVAAGAWVASVRTGATIAHPRFLGSFPDLVRLLDALHVAAA